MKQLSGSLEYIGEQFGRKLKKGVFPYAYVDCMERSWDGKYSLKVVASAINTIAEAKRAYAYALGEITKGHILPESERGSSLELAWNGVKKSLLEEFGSAKAVGSASLEDLLKVDGINKSIAENIFNFFN